MTAAKRLAEFAAACREGLPSEVAADVPRRVLDVIGLMLAAQGDPAAEAVQRAVRRWGGATEATALGVTGQTLAGLSASDTAPGGSAPAQATPGSRAPAQATLD